MVSIGKNDSSFPGIPANSVMLKNPSSTGQLTSLGLSTALRHLERLERPPQELRNSIKELRAALVELLCEETEEISSGMSSPHGAERDWR